MTDEEMAFLEAKRIGFVPATMSWAQWKQWTRYVEACREAGAMPIVDVPYDEFRKRYEP